MSWKNNYYTTGLYWTRRGEERLSGVGVSESELERVVGAERLVATRALAHSVSDAVVNARFAEGMAADSDGYFLEVAAADVAICDALCHESVLLRQCAVLD